MQCCAKQVHCVSAACGQANVAAATLSLQNNCLIAQTVDAFLHDVPQRGGHWTPLSAALVLVVPPRTGGHWTPLSAALVLVVPPQTGGHWTPLSAALVLVGTLLWAITYIGPPIVVVSGPP